MICFSRGISRLMQTDCRPICAATRGQRGRGACQLRQPQRRPPSGRVADGRHSFPPSPEAASPSSTCWQSGCLRGPLSWVCGWCLHTVLPLHGTPRQSRSDVSSPCVFTGPSLCMGLPHSPVPMSGGVTTSAGEAGGHTTDPVTLMEGHTGLGRHSAASTVASADSCL